MNHSLLCLQFYRASAMSSPTVLLNNLVQEEDNSYVDPISKTFLIGEALLGLNRVATFGKIKPIFLVLAYLCTLVIGCHVFVMSFFIDNHKDYSIVIGIDAVEYISCIVISTIAWKRLRLFFNELQKFDGIVGCRPKITSSAIKNTIQMCIVFVLMLLFVPYELFVLNEMTIQQLIVRLLYVVEIHYYGHLLSLLVPRLRIINYYMKMSLANNKNVVAPKVEKLPYFKANNLELQNSHIKKLMELYCIIINAYDLLIEAIKWQFLAMLTTSFISVLSFAYLASLMIIRGTRPFMHVVTEAAFTALRLLPMFAPCLFGDQIHDEVRRLRELLASRLYENQLNKSGRSVARAMLALTEARNLSFSLLQIFDINISLPFKFMGLLLTYLIILLQFEKVINPN